MLRQHRLLQRLGYGVAVEPHDRRVLVERRHHDGDWAAGGGVTSGLVAAAPVVEVGNGVVVDDLQVGRALGRQVDRTLAVRTVPECGVGGRDEKHLGVADQVGLLVGDVIDHRHGGQRFRLRRSL